MKKVFSITISLLIVFKTNTCCFRSRAKIHPKDDIANIAKNITAQIAEAKAIALLHRKKFEAQEKYTEERAALITKIRSTKINPDLFKPAKSAFFGKLME